MFVDGDVTTNIAVNNYIAIGKGFLSIIRRMEGERIEEDFRRGADDERDPTDRNKRIPTVALTGDVCTNRGVMPPVGSDHKEPRSRNQRTVL